YGENGWQGAQPASSRTLAADQTGSRSAARSSRTSPSWNAAPIFDSKGYRHAGSTSMPATTEIPPSRRPEERPPAPQNRSTAEMRIREATVDATINAACPFVDGETP